MKQFNPHLLKAYYALGLMQGLDEGATDWPARSLGKVWG